ncbi:hypothetical protein BD310DRAFT_939406 [Dichomitus squalens]|uniref:Uncharacterized protein n=1 Tax=Dichomitus squalens TaxID=114155 RepID=A0A4Q9PH11_9APHY|nr:hypothetical protein BD310DRAFT_939406 [Dichomitus squalens]
MPRAHAHSSPPSSASSPACLVSHSSLMSAYRSCTFRHSPRTGPAAAIMDGYMFRCSDAGLDKVSIVSGSWSVTDMGRRVWSDLDGDGLPGEEVL